MGSEIKMILGLLYQKTTRAPNASQKNDSGELSLKGFMVQGSRFKGFRVQGSRFRVQGSGFRVQGSRFRVQGSGFRFRFKVQGSRFRFRFKVQVQVQVQGSGSRFRFRFRFRFKVQVQGSGSRFNGFRWRLRRILDDGIPVSSAFPSRGRCPEGADRALAAGKTDEKAERCTAYVGKA